MSFLGLKSRNLIPIIAVVIGVSVISGGWYLLQPQEDKIDFSITDIDGNTINLSAFKGEVILLDFMATWCGPCKASMPGLVSLYNEIGDQFVMISITVDPSFDTVPVLRDWMEMYEATWIHARDLANPPVTQQFEVTVIPTYVIIDRKGEIRFRHVGLVSELNLKTDILSLINE
jgi:cytochrome oxidase Cu insertion factor (SCO1/SenC/PrrC family)